VAIEYGIPLPFLPLLAVFLGKLTNVATNNTQQISDYHYHHHQQQKQSKALPTYMQYRKYHKH